MDLLTLMEPNVWSWMNQQTKSRQAFNAGNRKDFSFLTVKLTNRIANLPEFCPLDLPFSSTHCTLI